jgi:hypothetical protein
MTDIHPKNDPHKFHPQQPHLQPQHSTPSGGIKKAHSEQPNTQEFKQHTSMDPAGIWSRFLSQGGQAASSDEVKGFLTSMQKMLQITVQQNARAAKRAAERLRDSQEGR